MKGDRYSVMPGWSEFSPRPPIASQARASSTCFNVIIAIAVALEKVQTHPGQTRINPAKRIPGIPTRHRLRAVNGTTSVHKAYIVKTRLRYGNISHIIK